MVSAIAVGLIVTVGHRKLPRSSVTLTPIAGSNVDASRRIRVRDASQDTA